MRYQPSAFATISLLALVSSAFALQATTTAPAPPATATAPAGAINLVATISAVKGVVQVRQAEDKPWIPATVGMKLTGGAELRTGLRSAVEFTIPPDQTITLDRLGTVKVLQAYLDGGKVKTDLGLKYGRTKYDIKSTNLEHESTIRSPGSTLAIRGTTVIYEDQAPWTPNAVSLTGRAQFRNARRDLLAFGGAQKAAVAADKSSAAQVAVQKTRVDPRSNFAGRTDSETELLLTLTSGGGADRQGLAAIQALQKIGGFKGTFAGVPPVPGPLEFRLDWFSTAASPQDTNLDLLVTDPKGRVASFSTPVIGTGTAMGQHSGDDPGLGGVGAEGVVWGLFFPPGKYNVQAINRGGDAASVFITVFQGQSAEPIKTFGIEPDPAITLNPGEQFNGTVTTQNQSTAAARTAATARSTAARPAAGPVRPTPTKPAAAPARQRTR